MTRFLRVTAAVALLASGCTGGAGGGDQAGTAGGQGPGTGGASGASGGGTGGAATSGTGGNSTTGTGGSAAGVGLIASGVAGGALLAYSVKRWYPGSESSDR